MANLQIVSATRATARVNPLPADQMDKTRFLYFGTADFPGNTDALWQDESGKGNHLPRVSADDYFSLGADAGSVPSYYGSEETGGGFLLPWSLPNATEYTIHILLRPEGVNAPYLLDAGGHSLGLGFNASDLAPWYSSGKPGPGGAGLPSVAPGELALLSWRLAVGSMGGRVYKNGVLVHTGQWFGAGFNPGVLGHDFSTYYAPFFGRIYAFTFEASLETDSQFAESVQYLAAGRGLSL